MQAIHRRLSCTLTLTLTLMLMAAALLQQNDLLEPEPGFILMLTLMLPLRAAARGLCQ